MPEWVESTPWWVFAALIVALVTALLRLSRWTGKVDTSLEALASRLGSVETELGSVKTEVVSVKLELGSVKTELGLVRSELGSMKTELGSMKTELGSVMSELGSVMSELGSVRSELGALSDAVSGMQETLKGLPQRPPPALTPGSPLRLSESGHRISDRLGAGEIADSLAGALRPRAEGLPAYDIQELSFEYAKLNFTANSGPDLPATH